MSEAFDLIEYNAADEMSELEWQGQLINEGGLMPSLGFLAYHTHDSRMCPQGFPDLHVTDVFNDLGRVLYIELKRQKNYKITTAQEFYLDVLEEKGHECYLARPRDLERLTAVLQNGKPKNHHWRDWIKD